MPDEASDYIPEPGEAERESDALHLKQWSFKGECLAPPSTGAYLLFNNLVRDTDSTKFYVLLLVYLLRDLQKRFEVAKGAEEDRWSEASRGVLIDTQQPLVYRIRMFEWASRLEVKDIDEATKLVAEMSEAWKREQPEEDGEEKPSDESEGLVVGK